MREIWLLKLNSLKHNEVSIFLLKIEYLLHQFTSMEFTKVINNGDSLTYKTRMDLQDSEINSWKITFVPIPITAYAFYF